MYTETVLHGVNGMKTGERIKALRESQGWTQYDLAERLSVAQSTINRYENGRVPDSDMLCRIADLFTVTTDYLLGRDVPLPQGAKTAIKLNDGRVVSIDELSPEDRRIVEEVQAFIAAKLSRTDGR